MTDIYKKASALFVSMGNEIEDLDEAIRLLRQIRQCIDEHEINYQSLVGLIDSNSQIAAWNALTELVTRPWWSRVWILQEITLSRDAIVVCGKYRFSWSLLQALGNARDTINTVTWLLLQQSKTFHSADFLHASDRLAFICALKSACPLKRASLRPLLCGIRTSEATDPRDKVFSILGLLGEDFNLCEVDYRKTVEQVYVEAAAGFLRETGSLHFLSWAFNTTSRGGYLSRPERLPSWTPSWTAAEQMLLELQRFDDLAIEQNRPVANQNIIDAVKLSDSKTTFQRDLANRASFINRQTISSWKCLSTSSDSGADPQSLNVSGKRIYSATQDSRSGASCDETKGTLTVLAAGIDILEDVSPPTTCGSLFLDASPAFHWIKTVFNKKLGLSVSNMEGIPDEDSDSEDEAELAYQFSPTFWRVILADQWRGVRLGEEVTIPGAGSIPPKSVEELFKIRGTVTSQEHQAAFRNRLLFTSRLTVGLVPSTARTGDIILAILGCDVPYLVRKCEDGYKLLGECYVHGFMDGDLFPGLVENVAYVTLV